MVSKEGEVSDHIKLLVGGKVECFRMIKESKDKGPVNNIKLSLEPRQGTQELSNVFGDLLVTKLIS